MAFFQIVSVFPAGPGGGNPAPVVTIADGLSEEEMRDVAKATGHECAFVLSPPAGTGYDFEYRFWVPNHEMEMCGHAAVGATWLLAKSGRLKGDEAKILTRSGPVTAHISRTLNEINIEISQPAGWVKDLNYDVAHEILDVLRMPPDGLSDLPIQNAMTSRVKTLVPLKSVEILDTLEPALNCVEAICERLGSTGLYPYAVLDLKQQVFSARQFPKSSGYPEDAATGIAATALSFGLLKSRLVNDVTRPIRVRQGWAMGRPSEITVRFDIVEGQVSSCWLSGSVTDRSSEQVP